MTLPIQEWDYRKAVELAQRESIISDYFVFLFRNNSGYYVIDNMGLVNSDEKLIMKLYKGLANIS